MQILTATLVNYKEKEKKTFYFDNFLHHFLSLFLHGARGKVRRLAKSSGVICFMAMDRFTKLQSFLKDGKILQTELKFWSKLEADIK